MPSQDPSTSAAAGVTPSMAGGCCTVGTRVGGVWVVMGGVRDGYGMGSIWEMTEFRLIPADSG